MFKLERFVCAVVLQLVGFGLDWVVEYKPGACVTALKAVAFL